jgi:hypothetical protein
VSGNGQVPAKPRLDPDELTPADMRRAKVALGGRNPYELMSDPVDLFPLLIWCLRSRTDPDFTWEQAEATRFGDFDMGGGGDAEPDPQIGGPGSPGPEAEPKPASGSRTRRASSASAPSSAPTSTSPARSSTP